MKARQKAPAALRAKIPMTPNRMLDVEKLAPEERERLLERTAGAKEKLDATIYRRRHTFDKHWVCFAHGEDGAQWLHERLRAGVVESFAVEDDGRWWHHVSVSGWTVSTGGKMIAVWSLLAKVKHDFIGPDREAYLVFPPLDRHVNLAEVLHLWSCLDVERGEVLPRFEGVLGGVRTI